MDWITGGLTIAAMWLVAHHYWHGWLLGLVNQAFWFYLIFSRPNLKGLLPVCLALTFIYARALSRWYAARAEAPDA